MYLGINVNLKEISLAGLTTNEMKALFTVIKSVQNCTIEDQTKILSYKFDLEEMRKLTKRSNSRKMGREVFIAALGKLNREYSILKGDKMAEVELFEYIEIEDDVVNIRLTNNGLSMFILNFDLEIHKAGYSYAKMENLMDAMRIEEMVLIWFAMRFYSTGVAKMSLKKLTHLTKGRIKPLLTEASAERFISIGLCGAKDILGQSFEVLQVTGVNNTAYEINFKPLRKIKKSDLIQAPKKQKKQEVELVPAEELIVSAFDEDYTEEQALMDKHIRDTNAKIEAIKEDMPDPEVIGLIEYPPVYKKLLEIEEILMYAGMWTGGSAIFKRYIDDEDVYEDYFADRQKIIDKARADGIELPELEYEW